MKNKKKGNSNPKDSNQHKIHRWKDWPVEIPDMNRKLLDINKPKAPDWAKGLNNMID